MTSLTVDTAHGGNLAKTASRRGKHLSDLGYLSVYRKYTARSALGFPVPYAYIMLVPLLQISFCFRFVESNHVE